MIRHLLTLCVIGVAVVYGISLLAGVGFDALWSTVAIHQHEKQRVAEIDRLIAGQRGSASASASIPSRAVVVPPAPTMDAASSTSGAPGPRPRLGMSHAELLALFGQPARQEPSAGYRYCTYPRYRVVLRDGIVIGWTESAAR